MSTSKPPTILVFGANGMLGHTVYNFLKKNYPTTTFGTVRKRKSEDMHILNFDVYKLRNIEIVFKKFERINYIINCIGILPNSTTKKEMNFINAIFPHMISLLAEKYNSKLIHISTDAVFHPLSGSVDEHSPTSPTTSYGRTKLQGEPISSNAITIRTSIIGLDPFKHKGVLEWALKGKSINGFTNQIWSGCTTLQYARLCYKIISSNSFQKMKDSSSIFHFSPIREVTKHDIIKTFLLLQKSNKLIKKTKGRLITRLLKTRHSELIFIDKQKKQIKNALEELINFEKAIKTE
ncbi:MAG: sugar nucleotide-binding protein [Patescibacteria group bacterium]